MLTEGRIKSANVVFKSAGFQRHSLRTSIRHAELSNQRTRLRQYRIVAAQGGDDKGTDGSQSKQEKLVQGKIHMGKNSISLTTFAVH